MTAPPDKSSTARAASNPLPDRTAALEKQLLQIEGDKAAVERAVIMLQAELSALTDRVEQSQREASTRDAETRTLRTEIAFRDEQLRQLSEQLRVQQDELDNRHREIVHRGWLLETQQEQLQRHSVDNLRNEAQETQQRLEHELQVCVTEIARLNGFIDAIYESRSWRLTRPLRSLQDLLTRGS